MGRASQLWYPMTTTKMMTMVTVGRTRRKEKEKQRAGKRMIPTLIQRFHRTRMMLQTTRKKDKAKIDVLDDEDQKKPKKGKLKDSDDDEPKKVKKGTSKDVSDDEDQ